MVFDSLPLGVLCTWDSYVCVRSKENLALGVCKSSHCWNVNDGRERYESEASCLASSHRIIISAAALKVKHTDLTCRWKLPGSLNGSSLMFWWLWMGRGNSLHSQTYFFKKGKKNSASWISLLLTCLQSQGVPAEVGVNTTARQVLFLNTL